MAKSTPEYEVADDGFKLILVDRDSGKVDAWSKAFAPFLDGARKDCRVSLVCADFRILETYDCLVSAANSFGLMDGGIDEIITQHFDAGLQNRVQRKILDEWAGEQPVGTCLLVPTFNVEHPWLAHSPTMRTPLDIRGTDNVYAALWATLVAVRNHNRQHKRSAARRIHSLACCALGTGAGKMEYDECARQMALAWCHFVNNPADCPAVVVPLSSDEKKAKAHHQVSVSAASSARDKGSGKASSGSLLTWSHAARIQQRLNRGGLEGFLDWQKQQQLSKTKH